jgi:PEP-CTERM motif-containing protein
MIKGRILLIVALAVLCSTYAFADSMPGSAVASSQPRPRTVIHSTGSFGSHCDGDFGANTGICFLFEDFTADTDVTGNAILISPNNDVVTGVVGIFEPDGVSLSDELVFNFQPGVGTFVQLFSDPNTLPFTFNGTTNEAPCGPGVSEGCVAIWNVGNVYNVVSDTPEPSTIMLLGSGLFGAFRLVRRRLT